jgi:hypothetical protein
MPIEYRIDHSRRLVLARGYGTLSDEDVFGYQRDAWGRPEVAGYDELVDMTGVQKIALPSGQRVLDLAQVSAAMDGAGSTKFAIIAPDDFAFGLGRMYQTYRSLEPGSTREVRVFRTRRDALGFLGVKGDPWQEGEGQQGRAG